MFSSSNMELVESTGPKNHGVSCPGKSSFFSLNVRLCVVKWRSTINSNLKNSRTVKLLNRAIWIVGLYWLSQSLFCINSFLFSVLIPPNPQFSVLTLLCMVIPLKFNHTSLYLTCKNRNLHCFYTQIVLLIWVFKNKIQQTFS